MRFAASRVSASLTADRLFGVVFQDIQSLDSPIVVRWLIAGVNRCRDTNAYSRHNKRAPEYLIRDWAQRCRALRGTGKGVRDCSGHTIGKSWWCARRSGESLHARPGLVKLTLCLQTAARPPMPCSVKPANRAALNWGIVSC